MCVGRFDDQFLAHMIQVNQSVRRRAFTLLELLIILALLCLLVALVMPPLVRAREKANRVVCADNLRQIGVAMLAYVGDNQDHFPTAGDYPSGTILGTDFSWDMKLINKGYAGVSVFHCPSDRIPRNNPSTCTAEGTVPNPHYRTYAMACGATSDPNVHFIQGSRTNSPGLADLGGIVLVGECVNQTMNAYVGAKCSYWFQGAFSQYPPHGVHVPSDTNAGNYLFCDGHVTWTEAPTVSMFPTNPAALAPMR
jgi:prepilin-type processing-associated H-X9-DG protein